MKIICAEPYTMDGIVPFRVKPASALLLPHNPFFVPDFTNDVRARVGLAVKISKPGRSIGVKFAQLHYDSIAVALDVYAADLMKHCSDNKISNDMAYAFDSSFPVGEFVKIDGLRADGGDVTFSLNVNGVSLADTVMSELQPDFDTMISSVSQYVTLREGDYMFVPAPSNYAIKIGDRVELRLCGSTAFWFNVR